MLKKKLFGDDHEICYDSIINHDVYTFLRISVEVPREQDTEAFVLLNGREIGKVRVRKEGKKTFGYLGWRKVGEDYVAIGAGAEYRKFGKTVAAIISDYVR